MKKAERILQHGFEAIEFKASAAPASTILMLHGYGANMADLAPLSNLWDPHGQHRWIFLNAPRDMGYYGGRAWYDLDVEKFMARTQLMASGGSLDSISDYVDPGIEEAAKGVLSFLNASGIDLQTLVLGGFSQGAITSVQTYLMLGKEIKSLLLFSGMYCCSSQWEAMAAKIKPASTKALVSHGRFDEVLPYALGERLASFLNTKGLSTQFIGFNGGHEIPQNVIEAAKSYL
jgi:predicted esterase